MELAEEAGKQGTFAVGGLLVDESGHVIAEATNAVIRNGKLSDPTAHVERQLVDWLAQERRRRRSLSPRNLTIVSSLDPCAMCAGAILRSGMRVIIVAEDDFAGVHENLKARHMPRELQVQAQKDMAFFGVQGKRPRPAHVAPIFASDVSAEHVARSTDIFSASVKEVQQKVGGGGSEVGPRIFEPTGSVFSNLREVAAQLCPLVKIGQGPLNIRPSNHLNLLKNAEDRRAARRDLVGQFANLSGVIRPLPWHLSESANGMVASGRRAGHCYLSGESQDGQTLTFPQGA